MGKSWGRAFCVVQFAAGLVVFLFLVLAGPWAVPEGRRIAASLVSSRETGIRILDQSHEILSGTRIFLTETDTALEALETAFPKIRAQVAAVSDNLKYFQSYAATFSKAAGSLAEVYQGASEELPVKVPTGLSFKTSEVNLGIRSVNVPTGVSPTFSRFLEEEKESLAATSTNLATLSRKLGEASELMATGGGGLDEDTIHALAAAEKSLALARAETGRLAREVIPGYLDDIRMEKKELSGAGPALNFFQAAFPLLYAGAALFALLFALNGLVVLKGVDLEGVKSR